MSGLGEDDTSSKELRKRIEQLEQQVARFDQEFSRFLQIYNKATSGFGKFDELLMHHCNSHDRQFEETWARIKNLEFTVFPNLAQDLAEVEKIVPTGTSTPESQLDSRKKFPWKKEDGSTSST